MLSPCVPWTAVTGGNGGTRARTGEEWVEYDEVLATRFSEYMGIRAFRKDIHDLLGYVKIEWTGYAVWLTALQQFFPSSKDLQLGSH